MKKLVKKVVKKLNPKIGQFVFDKAYQRKTRVSNISKDGKTYYINGDEPSSRGEFLFPLPKTKKTKSYGNPQMLSLIKR
jgi:hypothetical protein